MAEKTFAAVDLGASSGRVLVGRFDGSSMQMEEVHRFPNGPVNVGGRMYWDVLGLWSEVQQGLASAKGQTRELASIGVDTWGVDFALLGRGDELLGNPRHYRDPHTDGVMQAALERVPAEEVFAQTGLQFMQINTLFQMLALKEANSPVLEAAESFLMIPDLFNWLLTGRKGNEFTNATTSQMFNPATHTWAGELLKRFGLPTEIFGEIIEPGTDLGPLLPSLADELGLAKTRVVAPGTHDTASAVLAVPASGGGDRPDWCYISSGTWSLLGAEVAQPVINDACRNFNFTNEGGIGRTIRLLKNITGLWLWQECRRIWQREGKDYSWDQITQMASEAPPLESLIPPDDRAFMAPADMPAAIREYCKHTSQTVPESDGAVARCCIESLALRSRQVLEWLEQLVGGRLETIHVVGGGSLNKTLCQATADACGREVVAGPVEATALGNLLCQAIAAGDVADVAQAREVVRNSTSVDHYTPQTSDAWEEAFARFVELAQ